MSSTPQPPERPTDPTRFGGEGLYDSPEDIAEATAESGPLTATLGEHLDSSTLNALQGDDQSTTEQSGMQQTARSWFDVVKRNPIPIALALGGIAWLVASRRSTRR